MAKFFLDNDQCQGQEEVIQLFLDDALTSAERAAFLAHVRRCRACQGLLTEFKAVFTALNSLADVPAPAGVVAQVMANLPARQAQPRRVAMGYWLLVSQIIVGLAVIRGMSPIIMSTFDNLSKQLHLNPMNWPGFHQVMAALTDPLWPSPWLMTLSRLVLSAAGGLVEWVNQLSQWGHTLQVPTMPWSGLNLSLEGGLVVAGSLGLAWLVANLFLLNQRHHLVPDK